MCLLCDYYMCIYKLCICKILSSFFCPAGGGERWRSLLSFPVRDGDSGYVGSGWSTGRDSGSSDVTPPGEA